MQYYFTIDYNNSKNVNYYHKLFNYLETNKTQLQKLKFIDFDDISDSFEGNDFTKTFGNRLKYKIGIYKIKIDSENNIIGVNPIKKTGLNEKQVLALIKKNIKAYSPSYKNSDSEYLLFLDF